MAEHFLEIIRTLSRPEREQVRKLVDALDAVDDAMLPIETTNSPDDVRSSQQLNSSTAIQSNEDALITDRITLESLADSQLPVDLSPLSPKGIKQSDVGKNGKVIRRSALHCLQAAILVNGGAASFAALSGTLKTWIENADWGQVKVGPVPDQTLRGWLSKWHSSGEMMYLPDTQGRYTLHAGYVSEAFARNPLLRGNEGNSCFDYLSHLLPK